MSNPFLNDKAIATASQAGWAAPDPNSQVLGPARTPISDGPVSHWDARVMTVGGTITATGVLLVLLLASATAGWIASPNYAEGEWGLPMLAIVGHPVAVNPDFRLRQTAHQHDWPILDLT